MSTSRPRNGYVLVEWGSDLGETHTEGGQARPRDHSTSGLRLSCRPWETIPDTRCLEAPLLKHEFPCDVTIASESPHEGLVNARWQQAPPPPSDNGDEPHGYARHDSARLAHGKALIIVHAPADHFPHDEREYVKMDLY
jgi:hypothetical protein